MEREIIVIINIALDTGIPVTHRILSACPLQIRPISELRFWISEDLTQVES